MQLTIATIWHTIQPRVSRDPGYTGNLLSIPMRSTGRSEASGRAWPSRRLRILLVGVRALAGLASLTMILQVALALRILAADAVDIYVHREGSHSLCIFPDTMIYWGLARTIRAGTTFEYVEWSDIPHFTLRTPGYPLFLAGCQALFGERTLAVRLVQAVLGALCVYLVYGLTRHLALRITSVSSGTEVRSDDGSSPRWTVPLHGRGTDGC